MRNCALVAAAILIASTLAPATTYVVRPDGEGDFETIQLAITGATTGDIIELTDGYFQGSGNYNISFQGKALTVRSQSGDAQSCVIDCQGSPTNNMRRGFLFTGGEGSTSVLEKVTIRDAYLLDESTPGTAQKGAGIYCVDSSPTITGCVFLNNQALSYAAGGFGGGMYCSGSSSPTLTNCDFEGNAAWDGGSASRGGGLYCAGAAAPTLVNCVFEANDAAGMGAGVFCGGGSAPTLIECSFIDNDWLHGLACSGSSPQVVDCFFAQNFGANVECVGGSSPSFSGCIFGSNAYSSSYGVDCVGSSPSFVDCTFDVGWEAVTCNGSNPAMTRCTFYHNEYHVRCWYGSTPTLINCILASATIGATSCDGTSSLTLTCCDVYGNNGGDWVGCIAGQNAVPGNISQDPLFCGASGDDFTLQSDSPCAAANNPVCGRIGAWGVGCSPTVVEDASWSTIKAMFRNEQCAEPRAGRPNPTNSSIHREHTTRGSR